MKIYTLGTSHGATEIGRGCSGTVIKVKDSLYLFDCGGGIEGKMTDMGLPIKNIRGVFISHMHEDHAGGLSAIAKRFCVYICNTSVKLYFPEEEGISAFKNWFSALHLPNPQLLDFQPTREGIVYEDDNIRVSAIPTKHIMNGKYKSFAYLIEGCGKSIVYTGDLSENFCDYPQIISNKFIDRVICELTHFDVDKSFGEIAKSKTDGIIFTHIYPGKDELLLSARTKLNFDVSIASDGDCFEI